MSHSYLCGLLHIVFTTAERRPWIRDEMRDRRYGYLAELLGAYGIQEE
jgi:hypothetical protein